jgi:hypothetical protein
MKNNVENKDKNSENSNVLLTQNSYINTTFIENFDGLIDKQQDSDKKTLNKPYYVIFRYSHILMEKLMEALERVQREKRWIVV